jgi:hypothetical protein
VILLPEGSSKTTLSKETVLPKSIASHSGLPADGVPLACHFVLSSPSLALSAVLLPFTDEAEAEAVKERLGGLPREKGTFFSSTLRLATGAVSSGIYPSEVIVYVPSPLSRVVTVYVPSPKTVSDSPHPTL